MNRETSLYLDIIRPLAAITVLFSHFGEVTHGGLASLAGYGTQAVDAFFVLSGFVIAHVAATREDDGQAYLLSRAARIYSVAVPALLITLVLDGIGQHVAGPVKPEPYAVYFQPMSGGLLLQTLTFTGEWWNSHAVPGSDGPYWSLGFEVWYYVAFGAFLFSPPRWRWLTTALVLAFIGPKVAIMFPVWLMGCLAYRICRNNTLSTRTGWALFLVPVALVIVYQFLPRSQYQAFRPLMLDPERIWGTAQDYALGALFTAHIIGFSVVSSRFAAFFARHARRIRWIAGATFTIYLLHMPIMSLVVVLSPWPNRAPQTMILAAILPLMACFAIAEVTERRKDVWHRGLRWLLDAASSHLPMGRKALDRMPAMGHSHKPSSS